MEAFSKQTLAQKYGVSSKVLCTWMNVQFFDELQAVGYRKEMRVLPPAVVRKFIELFGNPLKAEEL